MIKTGAQTQETLPATEEFLLDIKKRMPPQPWPKGAAQTVARELGVPTQAVSRAIAELTKRGDFKFQFEGQLYEPVSARPNA